VLDRLQDISTTEASVIAGAVVVFVGYAVFLLGPAWGSYGRWWERFAAAFLSLYMLAALVGTGLGIGFAVVWSYDRWA
jgi:hypothetical protein